MTRKARSIAGWKNFLLCLTNLPGDQIENIIKDQQWNNTRHHTGGDGCRSDSPETEKIVKDAGDAGERKPFGGEPDQFFTVHCQISPLNPLYAEHDSISNPIKKASEWTPFLSLKLFLSRANLRSSSPAGFRAEFLRRWMLRVACCSHIHSAGPARLPSQGV